MTEQPQYYQPPEQHDHHIRNMVIALALFFGSVVIVLALVIYHAHYLASLLPFSVEKQFVKPYEVMAEQWGPEQTHPEVEVYLQDLADDLALAMDLPEQFEVQVHYLDHGTVNAFATLGGHVFMFRGLLQQMPDENALAMVLAHELAHIKHRDPVASLGRGFAIQMLYSFITGDLGNSPDLAGFGGELGMLFFSREQEEHADQVGLETLQAHYGHVRGYRDLFDVIAAQESHSEASENDDEKEKEQENKKTTVLNPELPNWLSSHPDTQDRIRALEERIMEEGWQVSNGTPIPEANQNGNRE